MTFRELKVGAYFVYQDMYSEPNSLLVVYLKYDRDRAELVLPGRRLETAIDSLFAFAKDDAVRRLAI